MSYAVKIGTTEAFWIDNAATPPGHVRFDGSFPENPTDATELVWGDDIQNLRVRTQAELDALPLQREQEASKTVGITKAVRLSGNVSNSTVNFADVTGLSFQLAPNSHYAFEFIGAYTAAAGTTGLQLGINGPANPSLVRMVGNIATSASAGVFGVAAAYDTAIAATASGGATALPFWVNGNISTGAEGGLFTLRLRSEVGGSAVTILSGSYGKLSAIG